MANWKDFVDPDARGRRFLPWKEVARATGLSRTTAWRLQKRHEFPAPYIISPGRVGYREDEVEAWRVSRDHSATTLRTTMRRPRPAVASDVRAASPAPHVGEDRGAAPEVRGASAAVERPAIPPPPLQQRAQPPARSAGPARRRSQHAKAIAQQMRFDF